MTYDIGIGKDKYGYYIRINRKYVTDYEIYNILFMDMDEYKLLTAKFNGVPKDSVGISYENIEDVNNFKEYLEKNIESLIIANKLIKG